MTRRWTPLAVAGLCIVVTLLVGCVAGAAPAGATSRRHEPARCTTAHLRLEEGDSDGAGGTSYTTWHLINAGAHACTLYGYPGFAGVNKAGHVVQHPARRNAGLAGNRPERTVTLHHRQRADFLVSSIDNVPSPGCHNTHRIAGVQVYPPGAKRALRGPSREKGICNLEVGYVVRHR